MNFKNLFIGIVSIVTLSACSNISDDERFVFVEHKELNGGDNTEFISTVLIEDFTGQRCKWCPEGTRTIDKQVEQYGAEKVIPVAIHAGGLSFAGSSKFPGFKTDLTTYYWDKNGFNSETVQPTAVFNRRVTSSERESWPTFIFNELNRKASVALSLDATFDSATRTVTITSDYYAADDKSASLQLWLLESGIVSLQTDGDADLTNYVHNHVLRDAINGNDGEQVTISKSKQQKVNTYAIPEKYVAENCHIVAFFYDTTGILQAAIAPVIKGAE